MIENRPNFTSKIPEHLLQGSSPRDKYVLEQLSIINQQNDWQADKLIMLDSTLNETKNNVDSLKQDVDGLKKKKEELTAIEKDLLDIVNTKQFIDRYILTRKFAVLFLLANIGLFFTVKVVSLPVILDWAVNFFS